MSDQKTADVRLPGPIQVILLVGLPPALLLAIGWYGILLTEERREREALQELTRNLQQLGQTCAPAYFFPREWGALFEELQRLGHDERDLRQAVETWKRKTRLEIEAYRFPASGSMQLLTPESSRAVSVMGDFWHFLRNGRDEFKYHFYAAPQVRTLFGCVFAYDDCVAHRGEVIRISPNGTPGYLYWNVTNTGDWGGVIFIVWEVPPLQALAERLRRNILAPDVQLVFQKADETLFLRRPTTRTLESGISVDDHAWTSFRIDEQRLFAGIPRSSLRLAFERRLLPGLAAAIGVVLVLVWWRQRRTVGRFLSIRWKLTGLFLYALALPLTGVGMLGTRLLHDREQVMSLEAMQAAQEYLASLDSDFLQEHEKLLQRFRAIRDDPLMREDMAALRGKVVDLGRQKLINWLEVRDVRGNILMTTEDPKLTAQIGLMARGMSRHTIDRHLSERLGGVPEKLPTPDEIMVQGVMQSPVMGWASMYERPDQLHQVRFGGHEVFWYWDIFRDPTHPAAVIQGDTRMGDLMTLYLNKRLQQRHGHGQTAFRILAWDPARFRWLPDGVSVATEVRGLAERVELARETVRDRLVLDGVTHLALGFPGKQLSGMVLLALFPDDEIRQATASLREGVAVGVGFVILLALMLARTFSEMFLNPIGELTRGVDALRRRDTDVRLVIDQRDEFGDLAQMFNQTIWDIKDMLFAREIQEQLIPRTPPSVPGYQLALVNLAAADLGGDYCDVVRMTNGRVLLVIGDVTGHGVSSALLMAMAKAMIFRHAEEAGDLCRFLERLNRMIFRLLQRKKMMTLFVCILNPADGALSYATAGHPYPIIVRSDGSFERLRLVHTPLGFREPAESFVVRTDQLMPGDLLFLFTDGILEARNVEGEYFGKQRLEEVLQRTHRRTPAEVRDAVIREVQAFQQVADDDLTMLVVKRDSVAGA